MQYLDHEKLDVYQASIEIVVLAEECASIFEICRCLCLIEDKQYVKVRELIRIVGMLTKMAQRTSVPVNVPVPLPDL
jgi:hypothetical protein